MRAYQQYQRGTLAEKAKRAAELEHTLETMITQGEATKRQVGAARGNLTRARQGLQEAIAAQLHKDEPYTGTNEGEKFEHIREQMIRAYSLVDEEIEKYRKA